MENIKADILEDVLQLCLEIVNSHSVRPFREEEVILISIEETQYDDIDIGEIRQFLYSEITTPFYLERESFVRIIDPPMIWRDPHRARSPKGLRYVQIDIDKMKNWTKAKLKERTTNKRDSSNEVWDPKFKFLDKKLTLKLPPYGQCEFSSKTIPEDATVNKRALLVKTVFNARYEGISAKDIGKKFNEVGQKKPKNKTLDAMIVGINKRFEDEFNGARVELINVGKGQIKKLRLSIYPINSP